MAHKIYRFGSQESCNGLILVDSKNWVINGAYQMYETDEDGVLEIDGLRKAYYVMDAPIEDEDYNAVLEEARKQIKEGLDFQAKSALRQCLNSGYNRYNPLFYKEVVKNYSEGKKYNIAKFEWEKSEKKTVKEWHCETINDFNRELWDLFAEFASENTLPFIWGWDGSFESQTKCLFNRNPEKTAIYFCDGIVFSSMREEFMGCVENQDVSHFMSFLVHYGYFNLEFNIIE